MFKMASVRLQDLAVDETPADGKGHLGAQGPGDGLLLCWGSLL